jgi:flagellar hook-associated protein 1 FlgK
LGALIPAQANSPFERDPMAAGGVKVTGIARAADIIRQDSLRRAEGNVARLDAAIRWLQQAESGLTGPAALAGPMDGLYDALAAVADDPASLAARDIFLAAADRLAQRFNSMAGELDRIRADLDTEAEAEARLLTGLAASLAQVNGQLRRATPDGGAAAGLMDDRDALLAELAARIDIDVRLGPGGMAEVRFEGPGGPRIVSGDRSEPLFAAPAADGGLAVRVGIGGSLRAPMGGSLGGLSLARIALASAREAVDTLAISIANDLNDAHAAGVDLDGAVGGPLFSLLHVEAVAADGNGGNARVEVRLADGASPPPLLATYRGPVLLWSLSRADGTAEVTGDFPLSLDGVEIMASGEPAQGDLFMLTPQIGAKGIALRPLSARQVAAAPAFLSDALVTNTGNARLEVRAGPPADPPIVPAPTPPFAASLAPGGELLLVDATGLPIGSGPAVGWVAGDGFVVRLMGKAVEGDSFRIAPTPPESGANGNALLLLEQRMAGQHDSGQDRLVTGVAIMLAESRTGSESAGRARDAAALALAEASGVDLNREASDMLRFQQAYQANARLIQTARETFEALLAAGR